MYTTFPTLVHKIERELTNFEAKFQKKGRRKLGFWAAPKSKYLNAMMIEDMP